MLFHEFDTYFSLAVGWVSDCTRIKCLSLRLISSYIYLLQFFCITLHILPSFPYEKGTYHFLFYYSLCSGCWFLGRLSTSWLLLTVGAAGGGDDTYVSVLKIRKPSFHSPVFEFVWTTVSVNTPCKIQLTPASLPFQADVRAKWDHRWESSLEIKATHCL